MARRRTSVPSAAPLQEHVCMQGQAGVPQAAVDSELRAEIIGVSYGHVLPRENPHVLCACPMYARATSLQWYIARRKTASPCRFFSAMSRACLSVDLCAYLTPVSIYRSATARAAQPCTLPINLSRGHSAHFRLVSDVDAPSNVRARVPAHGFTSFGAQDNRRFLSGW